MSVVIDTIHLAFSTVLAPDLLAAQKMSEADPDRNVVERGNWQVRAGSLKGFAGFTSIAVGQGPMEGMLLMLGPAPQDSPHLGARQVRVVIGSARCWRLTCDQVGGIGIAKRCLWDLEGDAFTSLPNWEHVKVRRIDVCVDHWGYPWALADLDRFACRQTSRKVERSTNDEVEELLAHRWVYRAYKGSTYYVGKRGGNCRLLRIYDKLEEAKATGKLPWLDPIWRQNGWNGEDTVWRAEIEHGGDWLQAHGFHSMQDLQGCEHTLWAHYLESVRHTFGDRTRLERCESSQVWKAIRAAVYRAPGGRWEWCPRPVTEETDCAKLITQAAGCILTAENHFGSHPWHGTGATRDDIRGDMLAIVGRALEAADRKRTDDAVKHLLRLVDKGMVTGEQAQAVLALVGAAVEVAQGQRLPSSAAKGQYKPAPRSST